LAEAHHDELRMGLAAFLVSSSNTSEALNAFTNGAIDR